jgi:acyl-CoA synthetase (AMP-forming)/AMP-acid ligase II
VGRLLPNVRLKLVSEEGVSITEEGKPGEAFIKTPMLFSGYLENGEANADAFDSDGFYRTGDQLYVQGGKLYYTDRVKETMKVHGWQVSPTELESVLVEHPQIADAAVVGVTRNNLLGVPETFPTAYVVRSSVDSANSLTGQDVKDFIASRLISYKRITGDVNFIEQIPRSAAGKILRRTLLQTRTI